MRHSANGIVNVTVKLLLIVNLSRGHRVQTKGQLTGEAQTKQVLMRRHGTACQTHNKHSHSRRDTHRNNIHAGLLQCFVYINKNTVVHVSKQHTQRSVPQENYTSTWT